MANVGVQVTFQTQSGRALTLNGQVAEGTETEVLSGGAGLNVVDGVGLGQYGSGEVITHALAVFSTAGLYAYILGQNGKIIMPLPVANDVSAQSIQPLCRPLRLETGMTCRVMGTAVAGNTGVNASVGFYCTDGSVEYMVATATDGNTVQFSSIQTGQTIGQTLSGKTVQKVLAATPLQLVLAVGGGTGQSGFPILSSEGYTKAVIQASNVQYGQPPYQMTPRLTISQNDTMFVAYDAS